MSTTIADGRPVDPDDELLVAYLDGELDNQQRDQVEQRLMDEEKLRQRLQTLQSSWEWLDDLPAATTNDKLVESTLELVVADIVSKSSIQPAHVEKSRWPLVLCGLALAAAVIGYAAVRWSQSQQRQQELRDIALAENLDAYLHGGDLKLMRELGANSQFNSMVKAAREVGGLPSEASPLVANVSLSQRADSISELPLEDRAFLETQWDRFQRLSPLARDTVRTTAAAVSAQPDPELLLSTMNTYAVWQDSLPDDLRDRIEKTSGEARSIAIDEAINRTLEQVRRKSGKSLGVETIKLIYITLQHFLDRRLAEDEELAVSVEQLGTQFKNPEGARRLAIRRMLGEFRGGFKVPSPSGPIESITPITDEELWSIIDVLTAESGKHDDALAKLDTLSNAGSIMERDELVVLTLRAWAIEAFERNILRPDGENQISLVDRYRELPPEVRDSLDLLPPQRLKAELDRLTVPRRFPGGFRPRGGRR